MKHFKNISTLSELKKAFRALVIANHPDKGGNLEAMQEINAEFEALYNSLKDCKETTNTGYETDYQGATAEEYTQHVYEEYGWTGKNYTREYNLQKLAKIFRGWLKKVYPSCKFSVVTSRGYRTVEITLMIADFNPFTGDNKRHYDISRYDVGEDPELTERAKDMFSNIRDYVNTYNYDHSDLMTDYYDTNFYISMGIGQYENPFKIEIPKERRANGAAAPSFHWEDGPAHKALKKALGKHYFAKEEFNDGSALVLGDTTYYNGKEGFSPLYRYCSGTTPARRCIEKLASIGVICELFHGCVKFVGYTPEMEQALKEEDEARERAFKEWQEKQNRKQEEPEQKETAQAVDGLEIVDYSEKAVAVFGETMEVKEQLKQLGGKFNPALKYGTGKRAGWIFPKPKREELERLAKPETVQTESESAKILLEKVGDTTSSPTPSEAEQPLTIRTNRKGYTLRGDDATKAAEILGLQTESTPEGVAVLRFDALYIDTYLTRLIRCGQRVSLADEPEAEQQPEHRRPPVNGQAFTAFASCLQKRIQQKGSEAGRRYAKRMANKYAFTLQQLRYTAYLIAEYADRSGGTAKPIAA